MKPNNQKKIIAITGGIASGKSTVAQMIRDKGYPVFSCDEIYKQICQSKAYKDALSVQFGNEILMVNGDIDRKKLSQLIFSNAELREKLNSIAHPFIMKELFQQIHAEQSGCVFAEVPLLFEGGYESQFDAVIVVLSTRENRIDKLMKRDGLTKTEAEQRINSQFDYDSISAKERMHACNAYIMNNNGSLAQLKEGVLNYLIENDVCDT